MDDVALVSIFVVGEFFLWVCRGGEICSISSVHSQENGWNSSSEYSSLGLSFF